MMKAKGLVLIFIFLTASIYDLPLLEDVEEAISNIKFARLTHQWWVDHDDELTSQEKRIGGGLEWHQLWVDRYDQILEILYWVQGLLKAFEAPLPRLIWSPGDRPDFIETPINHL
jgi:hypothetical protein